MRMKLPRSNCVQRIAFSKQVRAVGVAIPTRQIPGAVFVVTPWLASMLAGAVAEGWVIKWTTRSAPIHCRTWANQACWELEFIGKIHLNFRRLTGILMATKVLPCAIRLEPFFWLRPLKVSRPLATNGPAAATLRKMVRGQRILAFFVRPIYRIRFKLPIRAAYPKVICCIKHIKAVLIIYLWMAM